MSAITLVGLLVTMAVTGGTAAGIGAMLRRVLGRSRRRPVRANTPFVKADGLVKGLADLGVERAEVVGQDEVVVRAADLDWSREDVRFKRGAKGKFTAIVRGCPPAALETWLKELVPRYAYHVTLDQLAEQGFALASEETQQGGQIHLVLRRVA